MRYLMIFRNIFLHWKLIDPKTEGMASISATAKFWTTTAYTECIRRKWKRRGEVAEREWKGWCITAQASRSSRWRWGLGEDTVDESSSRSRRVYVRQFDLDEAPESMKHAYKKSPTFRPSACRSNFPTEHSLPGFALWRHFLFIVRNGYY